MSGHSSYPKGGFNQGGSIKAGDAVPVSLDGLLKNGNRAQRRFALAQLRKRKASLPAVK